jgi:putative lipoic acid-binding regulatory protein
MAVTQAASLVEYPSVFPIKVMGENVEGFAQAMIDLARRFDPVLDDSAVTIRPSRAGRYLGVTLSVTATSREQLDALYRTLTQHPQVKVVL